MITIEPFALSGDGDLLVINNFYNVGVICKGRQDVYYFKIHDEDGNTFYAEDLQTIIDKVNELNTVKPIVTIDIKRYAQAIINTSEDRESGTCTHCLVDTYYHHHKPGCIVLDAVRVLKEKQ